MKDTILIPSSVLTDESLSASEKLIAIYVLGTPDFIVPQEIIRTLKMSKNAVYGALSKFAKRGLLARSHGYRLAWQTGGENGA